MLHHPAPLRPVGKDTYEKRLDMLRHSIIGAQQKARESHGALVVIVVGLEGSGKGDLVWRLNEWLDPRGSETHSFMWLTDQEKERPEFWRFSQAMPARGRVGILFGAWYTQLLSALLKKQIKPREFQRQVDEINQFEEMMAADGWVFLKIFLQVGKPFLAERMDHLDKFPELHWRMLPGMKDQLKHYGRLSNSCDRMLAATDTAVARWHLVDAEDSRHRNMTVGKLLVAGIDKVNTILPPGKPPGVHEPSRRIAGGSSRLAQVDLTQTLDPDVYEDKIKDLQVQMLHLAWKAFRKRRSCLLVFEGWDAAGKGGAIRRVTQGLDPRLYQVVGFAAPTLEEKQHHYLWRFWRHLPPPGLTVIFDRSHYGRVLVERVEGFATRDEWSRAYDEINAFERQLVGSGYVICKFWLQISPHEQLKRFEARMGNPLKNHKINEEDWRNRNKWVPHEHAVEDMLALTSPPDAPWTVVPANDKRFARVRVIQTIVDRLKKALD